MQTEDGVKGAKVARDKAKQDFDRATALFQKQSLTKTDMEGATAQLDSAGIARTLADAKTLMPLAKSSWGLISAANPAAAVVWGANA